MAFLQRYVLSVVSAAMICGILRGLSESLSAGNGLRLLCSLFLSVVIVRPLLAFEWEIPDFGEFSVLEEAAESSAEGEQIAAEKLRAVISEQTEAYIAKEAAGLGMTLEISTKLQDGELPIPETVTLYGEFNPAGREALQQIIDRDLNIPNERQIWISKE